MLMPHPFALLGPITRRGVRALVGAALVTGALAACSTDEIISTTEPTTGPGTVYALASANDLNLPATFVAEGTSTEIRKGALTLGPDSTFIFSLALRTSQNGATPTNGTTTMRGTLQRSGDALALVSQGDTLFAGTYSPNTVHLLRAKAQVVADRFVFAR